MTIDARLEQVRRQLLDLTRRNRLLNFKPTGRRSVALRAPEPGLLYRWLAVEQRTIELAASPRTRSAAMAAPTRESGASPATRPQASPGSTEHGELAAPGDAPLVEMQPLQALAGGGDVQPGNAVGEDMHDAGDDEPPRSSLPRQRYRAEIELDDEQLHDRLFHLAREAESAQQEQGCDILYVALGLVEWVGRDEKPASYAPLVLVPVELVRRNAREAYRLKPRDDDPQLNPVLVELCRRDFGVRLPELDMGANEPYGELCRAVAAQLSGLAGWRLHGGAHLGLFSFAKLLMYLDLDPERWPEDALRRHELVLALTGLSATSVSGPPPIGAEQLDERRPHEVYQVLDADSSQQIALLTAKAGASMVIDGPPGTGKSQTITNLIAEFLAEGKRVLFVAEKAAALEVVKRRLDAVGLGDFVLELHSRKVSKRRVLDELDRALRSEYHPPAAADAAADELQRVRDELRDLARELHAPLGALGISPREAIERCIQHAAAPEAPIDVPDALAWTPQRLDQARQALAGLVSALQQAGGFENPWRGTRVSALPLVERQRLGGRLREMVGVWENMLAAAAGVATHLNIPVPTTWRECVRLQQAVLCLTGRVQLCPSVPTSTSWDATPSEASQLIKLCRRLAGLREQVRSCFHPRAEWARIDWERLSRRRAWQAESPWRWLNPRWYADGIRLAPLLKDRSPWDPLLPHQLLHMARLLNCRHELEALDTEGAALFGPSWQGVESDWRELDEYARRATFMRRLVRIGALPADAAARALTPKGREALAPLAGTFLSALAAWDKVWKTLCADLQLSVEDFLGGPAESVSADCWRRRLLECASATARLDDWLLVVRQWQQCAAAGLKPFLDWCHGEGRSVPAQQWVEAFLRQFYRLWFEAACKQRPRLAARTAPELDAISERFRQLDRAWLQTSRARLVAQIDARRPGPDRTASRSSRLGLLQAEIRRRRRIKPLRQLLKLCGDAVLSLKPCFLMSPISVAQFLEPGRLHFDVAIFDEASQIEPADALGAVARAKRLILVGDERQLPPTRFFSAYDAAELDTHDEDEPEQPPATMTDLESVLGIGHVCLPATMLRWHYRSRHESLIDFSNRTFYDGQLHIFPSPATTRHELGLSLRHMPHAAYARGGGRYNLDEARAVAAEVLEHARHYPQLSLGVGAFSLAQQRAIQDEIERLRRQQTDPACEAFFAAHPEEPFFVKNLETIQGDERDVILLSVGYGRDAQGKVSLNFGPLNREGGWRRLNVLVTRARLRCVVFSSLRADDLKVGPATPRGVRALRDFLEYAAAVPDARRTQAAHPGWIERDICRALCARGWNVVALPQPAPLDLAVCDPRQPDRYILGIQCDGKGWASAPTVRDRERLQVEVLSSLGWRVARVWSLAWLKQPQQVVERLERLAAEAQAASAPSQPAPLAPARTMGAESSALPGLAVPSNPSTDEPPQVRTRQGGASTTPQQSATDAEAGSKIAQSSASPGESPGSAPLPPGVQPYRVYKGRPRGTRKGLLQLPQRQLVRLLKEIVQVEWPIHRDELARRICGVFGTSARGEARTLIDNTIDCASQQDVLLLRGDFVCLPGKLLPPVRWRGGEHAVTDPRLIDPHEVAAAAVLAAQSEYGIPAEELPAAALRTMGFRRAGPQLSELARKAVDLALATGQLRKDAAGFLVPADQTP